MRKLFLVVLITSIFLCGCNNNKYDFSSTCAVETPAYSNLANTTDREWFSKQLEQAGVDDTDINSIMESIADYYDDIKFTSISVDSFQNFDLKLKEYDVETINTLADQIENFKSYNCKITAFRLIKNYITIDKMSDTISPDLEGDIDTILTSYLFDEKEVLMYKSLFGAVNTVDSVNINDHMNVLKKHWEDLGTSFDNNSALSLITVHCHVNLGGDDNRLIVGHAGVVLDFGNEILFFEKLSPTMPYQLIWLNNRSELVKYLRNCYVSTSQGCAQPFILENGNLLQ